MKIENEETEVKCTSCDMEMDGEDEVIVDANNRPFCSEDCYYEWNPDYEVMSAKDFIAEETNIVKTLKKLH